jgi:hypothetical protein
VAAIPLRCLLVSLENARKQTIGLTDMARRFYLSTRKDRSDEGACLSNALQTRGWECTYEWTTLKGIGPAEYSAVAQAEIDGIRQADVVIVLLPGGFGTHAEIGAALAFRKPIILHSPNRAVLEAPYPCVFHYHPMVKLIVSPEINVESIVAALPV